MSAVVGFGLAANRFEGALPESGLQVMRTTITLVMQENRFAGTLPNWVFVWLAFLSVSNNDLEGKII
eukprot:6184650-Amphidinium_carterae.1